MNELINYYEVIAKCGHVGKKHYIPIKFAVAAENGEEAAKKARCFARVKHDHKDAILNVTKIDYERFLEIKENNEKDPYLCCHSRQEQNLINGLEERMEIDNHSEVKTFDKDKRKARVAYKAKKNRIIEEMMWEDDEYDYAN